jgi:hypothetical protein
MPDEEGEKEAVLGSRPLGAAWGGRGESPRVVVFEEIVS